MKKLVLVFLVFYSFLSFAQFNECKEDLFPVRHPTKKMFGYVNIFGEWKIRPYYDLARPFKEGLAVVSRKKHYGLISCEGKVILPIDYEEIKDFVNGFSWVKKQGLWGLVDYKGKTVLECKYQEVVDVSRFDDYAWVKTGDLWGVFDKEQVKFIHQPQYDKYQQLTDQFSLVDKAGKKGMLNHGEKDLVLKTEFDAIDKFAPYLLSIQKNGKYGVVRDNGVSILETKYDALNNMNLAKFSVLLGDKYAVYDVWGKQYVPFVLDTVGVFVNNAALVKMNGSYGYINHKGRRVFGKYDFATPFINRIALVKRDESCYLIDRKGHKISEEYEKINLYKDYFSGFDGRSWRLSLYSNPFKISPQFKEVYGGLPSRVRVKNKIGMQFYSVYSSVYASKIVYDEIEDWDNQFAVVKLGDNFGLIDSSLKEVLAPKYRDVKVVSYLNVTYLKAINRYDKELMFNARGGQLLSKPYDKLDFAGRNKFIVCENSKCGVVTHKNEFLIDVKYQNLVCSEFSSDKYSWPLIVKSKGKFGLINKDASFAIKPKFEKCDYLGEGFFGLTSKGKIIYVNQKGEEVEKKLVEKKIKSLN